MSQNEKPPDNDLKETGPAFVAGATGFTGREVVRLLRGEGMPTRCPRATGFAATGGVEGTLFRCRCRGGRDGLGRAGNEENPAEDSTRVALRPPRHARARMHAAGRAGEDPASQSYEAVDYGLTALLVEAARETGLTPRVVHLSAAGVKETSRSAYYRARSQAEALLRSSGLPYTIARPSIIAGPGRDDDRPLEKAGAVIGDRLLSVAGWLGAEKIKARYASTTNVRLANALVRLALDPKAENRIFESEESE